MIWCNICRAAAFACGAWFVICGAVMAYNGVRGSMTIWALVFGVLLLTVGMIIDD